jgi:uncharacterized protein YcaQ
VRSNDLSLDEARRIALAAQGFDRPRPKRVDVRHLRRTIRQLGLIQIDYVNVLLPAQYQVPFSRLGPYDRSRFDDLVYREREFTEQWAHEASIIPMDTWPLLRHSMATRRVYPYGFEDFLKQNLEYAQLVLDQVRERGPLTAGDLPGPKNSPGRIPGAWFGTVPRATLGAHFGRGRLGVTNRLPNFQRLFDLAERVIPAEHYGREIPEHEAERELLRRASHAHGIGTAADLADYYRMPIRTARERLKELADNGELQTVHVQGWKDHAYLDPNARLPRQIRAASVLSPFDPLVWFRPRVARLFDFEYRIEIFFPKAKRKWGYYVLPFLLGDRLVARVDLKADRAAGRLLVLAAHLEPKAPARKVAQALTAELQALAGWLRLESVKVGRRGDLAVTLRKEVQS